ncbi:Ig-like domain-containing protein [Priestia taiwanensis]|uniref:DUF11 domain-containing protein n=1 Tax=Priestia taiwanensis TaxID=1347902 RepID=A0A917ARY3_9BACI|nr:Ig-like domain-containing protein [Priestia taiwanensis]MBM7363963.1 hypothetical protein [Priestia taiwanensis]GGE70538.1 hypothetical protein GCM10007140_20540 [Priestia taiwanensis]
MKDEQDIAPTIRIIRRTDKEKVIIGDIVRYSVTLHNDFPYMVTGLTIVENISPDVLLLPDSFSCENARLTIDQASAILTCHTLEAYEQVTFYYQILITNRPTSLLYASSSTVTYTAIETEYTITTDPHSLTAITTASSTGSHVPQTNSSDQSDTSFMNRFAQKINIPIVYDYRISTPMNLRAEGNLRETHYVSFQIQRQPKHGIADINTEGKWSYTPYQDHIGTDFFIIDIFDHFGNKYYFNMIISTQKIISPTHPTIIQHDDGRRNMNNRAKAITVSQPEAKEIIPTISPSPELDVSPISEQSISSEERTPTTDTFVLTSENNTYNKQPSSYGSFSPNSLNRSYDEQLPLYTESIPTNEDLSSDEQPPILAENIPVDENVTADEQLPIYIEPVPTNELISSDEQPPILAENIPIDENITADEQLPIYIESVPTNELISSDEQPPILAENIPIDENVTADEQLPIYIESVPTNELISSNERPPIYVEILPIDEPATSDDQLPIHAELVLSNEETSFNEDTLAHEESIINTISNSHAEIEEQLTFDDLMDELEEEAGIAEQLSFDDIMFTPHDTKQIVEQTKKAKQTIYMEEKGMGEGNSVVEEETILHSEHVVLNAEPTIREDDPVVKKETFLHNVHVILNKTPTIMESNPVVKEETVLPNEHIVLNIEPTTEEVPIDATSNTQEQEPVAPLSLNVLEAAYMGAIDETEPQQEEPTLQQETPVQQSLMPLGANMAQASMPSFHHYNLQLVHKRSLIPVSLSHHDDEATPFKLVNTKGDFGTFSYLTRKGNSMQEEFFTVNLTKFMVQSRQVVHHNEGSHHGE